MSPWCVATDVLEGGKTHPCSSRSPQQHGMDGVFSCLSLRICQATKWRMLFGPALNLHITDDTLPCGGTSCLFMDVPVWNWSQLQGHGQRLLVLEVVPPVQLHLSSGSPCGSDPFFTQGYCSVGTTTHISSHAKRNL